MEFIAIQGQFLPDSPAPIPTRGPELSHLLPRAELCSAASPCILIPHRASENIEWSKSMVS